MINDYDKAPLESTPTNPIEFEDHRRQLLYKLVETDTMGKLAKVTMKVVSAPVQTNRMVTSGITSADQATSGMPLPFIGNSGDNTRQIMFRGRIEAGDGFISPHYMWDDPCDVALFKGDNERLLQTIANHTLCISKIGYDGPNPKVGDKVAVLVKPSDVGPMALQILHFQSVEDVVPPEQAAMNAAANRLACEGLSDLFGVGSGGFISNLNLTPPEHYNSMQYPSATPAAKSYPYDKTIAKRIAEEDDGLWPAKVWFNETDFEIVEGFYAPMIKGLPVKSLPQKDRPIPYRPNETRDHKGIDIGTGGSGDLLLYPCLPGIIYRGANFKSGQPTTDKMAIINIVSPIEFEDGTKMTLTTRYMHLSMFGDNTTDGSIVRWSSHPPPSIGVSGGAVGQVGANGSTGPHLHWELRQSDFNKTVSGVPRGTGGTVLAPGRIYIGKSINPTNGAKSRTGAPPPQYDDSDMIVSNFVAETHTSYPEGDPRANTAVDPLEYSSDPLPTSETTPASPLPTSMRETAVEG